MRSLLFVPAEENKLKRIHEIKADAFIIDLEDSIKEQNKAYALDVVCSFLSSNFSDKKLYIRINPSNWSVEYERLKNFKDISFAIPKVESASDLAQYEDAVKDRSLLAFIESPLGMVNIKEIVNSRYVGAIGFGAEDYCARTGIRKNADYLREVQSQLVMYAKAYNKYVYDMVEAEYLDLNVYQKLVNLSKEKGFDGKLAIHPRQVDVINNVFDVDIEKIKEIVRQYDESKSGFVIIDNQIYEKPHIERLRNLY